MKRSGNDVVVYGSWWSVKAWFGRRAIRHCLFCEKYIWPWQSRVYATVHGMWRERYGVKDYYAHEGCGIVKTDLVVRMRSPVPVLMKRGKERGDGCE